MSETDNNRQGEKPKTSKLAIASVVFSVLGLLAAPQLLAAVRPVSRADILARNMAGVPALVALILGIVGLSKIRKSAGMVKGRGFAITGIVLATLFLGLWIYEQVRDDWSRVRRTCGTNLRSVATAMMVYAHDNGKYPTEDKWCDLLVQGDYASKEQFVCIRLVLYWPLVGGEMFVWPFAKKGKCDYAINPNATLNSPGDMVLLFETKGGWNQFGGAELLTADNHNGNGANILFNDMHVKFESRKVFGELKWKDEQKQ